MGSKHTKIHASPYGGAPNNYHIDQRDDELHIDLTYPPRSDAENKDQVRFVVVGIEDVRAADSIRISYDFDRDGYSIQQASTFAWEADDPVCDPDWQEVAFVQAWAREKPFGGGG